MTTPDATTTHHGIRVITLHSGDPIPTPRAPERWVAYITPDLARYLLAQNHPHNRGVQARQVKKLARDMAAGRYVLNPLAAIVFDRTGKMSNGQHTLHGVIESGTSGQWILLDLGWPEDLIYVLDQGRKRSGGNVLEIADYPNATVLAAAVTKVWQYDQIAGDTRQFSGMPTPTERELLDIIEHSPSLWGRAATVAGNTYKALSKGNSTTCWAACFFLIARDHSLDAAELFFGEVQDGAGEPGSATRKLRDYFMRRTEADARRDTKNDTRAAYEIVLRAFGAWVKGGTYHKPTAGFTLSSVVRPRG